MSESKSAEKYLAIAPRDYLRALVAGAGAGIVTAGTVFGKFLILFLKLPLSIEGLLVWLNYASSFGAIQKLGFRLATKQPAILAAALIGKSRIHLPHRILGITRSQFAASLGNLILVMVSAGIFHSIYFLVFGSSFLDAETARHSLESLDPFSSATIPFAALTGVLLWLSSLAPSRFTNLSLALMLAGIPSLGKMLGFGLDVRHFTLSGGSLTLAVTSLGLSEAWGLGLARAMLGVSLIGIINCTVSFILSLAMKLLLRPLNWREVVSELWKAAHRFFKAPWEFLLPFPAAANSPA